MAHSDFLKEHREKLPIFKAKTEILKAISQNKTVIVIGETASGKTTQIPQVYFIYFGFRNLKFKCC